MSVPSPEPVPGPLNPRQTRDLLATLRHSPRKALGQNFLVDANIVRKSLELAQVMPGDTVVEIGPGLGTLTTALLEAGACVHAIERDRVLAQHLRARIAPLAPGRFFLCEGDAVERPLAGLPAASAAGPFKVVANLPYAISTPWMDALLESPSLPVTMVLMLQREAAERLVAQPGSKALGAISIALHSAYGRAPGHAVPSACFFPRPRVDSVLLHLRRLAQPRRLNPLTRRFLRALFLHRRKQLGSILKTIPASARPPALDAWLCRLPEWGVDATVRPEAVPFVAWRALDTAKHVGT
ncbi:MAG: 16S rRNA (adenine(1518)-N(6)/adenine(1519)-N(6))-dimethyltransferase RsmA [Puniceicoccales bacterium]|nr:16S rRNA (adenine(1518)-N(6)/adenine(1519)-N(6))-dimethyltransferase RsmA [Puniceicoccales bacterium]